MHVPAGLGEKRWNMARRTPRRTIEQRLAALRSFLVEASFPRFGRRNSELIELQRAQLGGDQVGIIADVAEPVRRRDGKAHGIVEARVKERALAVHLEVGDECVPVRDRAPARPGVKVHADQAEGRRNESRRRLAVGAKRLAVQEYFGVKLPRPPSR